MSVTVSYVRESRRGVRANRVRFASDGPSGKAAQDALRREFSVVATDFATQIEERIKAAYPDLSGITPYISIKAHVYSGVTIKNPAFFYQEWDTKPHWPPFGKNSALYAWGMDRGLTGKQVFYIARSMAPVAPTNAVVGGHRMTVGGLGGKESLHRAPRMVATQGRYIVHAIMDEFWAAYGHALAQATGSVLAAAVTGGTP